jgi:hypothetical protein
MGSLSPYRKKSERAFCTALLSESEFPYGNAADVHVLGLDIVEIKIEIIDSAIGSILL